MRKLLWSLFTVLVVVGLFAQVGCRLGGDFGSGETAAVDTSYTITGNVALATATPALLTNLLAQSGSTLDYSTLTANLYSGFTSTTPVATAAVNASGTYIFTGITLSGKAYIRITGPSGKINLYVYADNITANTTALNVNEDTTVVAYIIRKAIADGGTNVTVANVSTTSADFTTAKTAFVALLNTADASTFTNAAIDSAAGTAIAAAGQAPALTLDTTTVAFGSVNVNTTSASQTVTITNTGATALTISSFTVTGPYAVSLTAPATVAASGTLSFTVSFSPKAVGALNGSISIISNAPTSPTTVTLTGSGLAVARIDLSAPSLAFGDVGISQAATRTLTLTNGGNVAVNITGITVNGPFAINQAAPIALATGASTVASITFVPTAFGTVTGSVVFTTDMTGSTTITVPLTGRGLINGPDLTVSKTSHAFGTVRNGEGATATITLTNNGNQTLTISAVTPSAEFATNLTTGTLASLASQTIEVYFRPTTTGAKTGTLTITSDSATATTVINFTGTAIATAASSVALSTSVTGQTLNGMQIWFTPITNTNTVATITLSTSAGNKDLSKSAALSFTANPATGVTAQTMVLKFPTFALPDPTIDAFQNLTFSTPLPTLTTVQVYDANAGAVIATGTIQ